MMFKYCFITLVVCFVGSVAYGQSVSKGTVYEDKTRFALSGIHVLDLENKKEAITDDNGLYIITAKVGDRLLFTAMSYKPDTVVIADQYPREIHLVPKENMLGAVTINQNNVAVSPGAFKTNEPNASYLAKNVAYKPDGGVALTLPDWNKDEKKKERDAKMMADEEVRDKIALAFNAATVAKMVPLKGSELDDFVLMYRPDVKVYTAKGFNMPTYVSDCYIKFMKLPPDQWHLTVQ